MSDFLNQFRATFNESSDQAINYAATTYNNVSTELINSASEIIPMISNGILNPVPVESQTKPINILPEENKYINPFEKQFESLYMGCFIDDPSIPSIKNFLGDISNISECINLGKENNYKYVGIQQGNKCFGSNNLPTTQQYDREKYCNIGCDDINTGKCGGFYFNQVYKTVYDNSMPVLSIIDNKLLTEETNKKEAINLLENFMNSDGELDKIKELENTNNNSWLPINSYILFFWILILIILIYLLFEYLYKKKDKTLIV